MAREALEFIDRDRHRANDQRIVRLGDHLGALTGRDLQDESPRVVRHPTHEIETAWSPTSSRTHPPAP